MAFSKAHRFKPADYHYSLVCKALSHPARLVIVRKLYHDGPLNVKQISAGMEISQPSLSQHLHILRDMQIVQCEQQFPTVIYWLNEELPGVYHSVLDHLHRTEILDSPVDLVEVEALSRITRPSAYGI